MSIGRKQRQQVAFGAGVDAIGLRESDKSASKKIFKGVVGDTGESEKILQTGIATAVEGVSGMLELGKKYHDEKVIKTQKDAQKELLDEYLPDREVIDSEQKELAIQNESLQRLKSQQDSIRREHIFNQENIIDDEKAMDVAVSIQEKTVNDQIQKLALAKTQGRISPREFLDRSRQLIRTAVAENPTLEEEIIASSKRLFEIHGVKDQISLDEKTIAANIAAQKDRRTNIIDNYNENFKGRPFPLREDGSINLTLMVAMNAEKYRKTESLETFEYDAKINNLKKEQIVSGLSTPRPDGGTGLDDFYTESVTVIGEKLNGIIERYTQAFKEAGDDKEKEELHTQLQQDIRNTIDVGKEEITNQYGYLRGDQRGIIDKTIARWEKNMEDIYTNVKDEVSGESLLKMMEIREKINNMHEMNRLFSSIQEKYPNMTRAKFDLLQKAINNKTLGTLIADHPKLTKSFTGILEFIWTRSTRTEGGGNTGEATGSYKHKENPPEFESKENRSVLDTVVDALVSDLTGKYLVPSMQGFSRMAANWMKNDAANDKKPRPVDAQESMDAKDIVNKGIDIQLKTIKQAGDLEEQFERQDELFKQWVDPRYEGALSNIDPEMKTELANNLEAYLHVVDKNMLRDIEIARKNGVPIKVSMDLAEVSFSTDNINLRARELASGNYIRGLTSKVSKRVRWAKKVLANLHNKDSKDKELDKLIKNYMPNLTQELEFSSPEKAQEARDRAEAQKSLYNTPATDTPPKDEEEPNEKKKDSSEDVIVEELTDEVREEIKNHPWYEAFKKKEGYYPDLNTNQFRYQAAWEDGMRPEIGKDGDYHWGSKLIDGSDTKVNGHKTIYKNEISEEYGEEMVAYLDEKGITNREEAMKLIEIIKTTPSIHVKNNNKDLGYGVRNDPTQGYKGDGFIAGKHTVTMEDGEEVQVTEYTVGVEIKGKIVDVPSINAYTTEEDMKAILESVRTGKPLPQEIEEKAQRHALDRIDAEKSIYLEKGEEQVPFARDRFGGAKDLTEEVENLKGANEQKQFVSYMQKVENRKLMEGDGEEFRHDSQEGGLDTIGFGHKLTPKENKTNVVYGYNLSEINESTPPEKVLEIANDILQKDLAKAEQILIKTHGDKFTKLDRRRKQMLIDFQFNVKNFKNKDVFPKFKAAIFAGDEKTMKKEYKRAFKSGGKWKSLGRNKDFKEMFLEKKIWSKGK